MTSPRIPNPLILADATWPEASAAMTAATIVLLPIGAIEAHGPHLPLDTDVVIATEVARRGGLLLATDGHTVVIAPPLAYGVSYVGTCFPGTTPLPADAVVTVVEEVLIELARQGPRRLCVVNAHLEPDHVAAVETAVDVARERSGAAIAFPDKRAERWSAGLSDEFRRGMRHAGAYETSLMLAAAPDRVRQDLLPALPSVLMDLPAALRAGARTFVDAGGVDGYFGDPASATPLEGERLFTALAKMIRLAVSELSWPVDREA